jgi:hypothetical protein
VAIGSLVYAQRLFKRVRKSATRVPLADLVGMDLMALLARPDNIFGNATEFFVEKYFNKKNLV